jgi:hypothetical protein
MVQTFLRKEFSFYKRNVGNLSPSLRREPRWQLRPSPAAGRTGSREGAEFYEAGEVLVFCG